MSEHELHQVTIVEAGRGYRAVCECTWKSVDYSLRSTARMVGRNHTEAQATAKQRSRLWDQLIPPPLA